MSDIKRKHITVAVASGKGGTGKTTVATNLVKILEDQGITLLDCDVEAPNSHLFLKPRIEREETHHTFIPVVGEGKCTACGKCSELCQFHAIMTIKDKVLVFPGLCHGCEGCKLICPEAAISDGRKEVGSIIEGFAGKIRMVYGKLRIGEAMSPPLIREVKRVGLSNDGFDITIIDAPPGTSCPVIESLKESDVVVLVTEPTPFGLHDLRLAVDMVRTLGIPFGVVINRYTIGDRSVWQYCDEESIPIILEIPDDRKIAEAYSRGEMAVEALPQYRTLFDILLERLKKNVLRMERAMP